MIPANPRRHRSGIALAPRTVGDESPPNGWSPYWESLSDRQQLYREQAGEYVRNLAATGFVQEGVRVLDFGCGFGLVAEQLAPRVGSLYLWDASPGMRRRARDNVAGHRNVRVLDHLERGTGARRPHFDLILVNSVVQYMTPEEFSGWLGQWASMLAPSGRLVVSDVIPPGGGSLAEFLDLLRFSARRRFLVRAVWQALGELSRYRRTRQAFPLTRLSVDDLRRRGQAAGLAVTVLPRNLTHFPRRITAVFTPIATPEKKLLG